MMKKLEKLLKVLLFFCCLVLLAEMTPALIKDQQRIFRKSGPVENEGSGNNEKLNTESLPKVYDGRDSGISPRVKDQGNVGNCWAVAATTTLEASVMPDESICFSESHMSEENFFSRSVDGGDYTMIMAYLAGWQGPVDTSSDTAFLIPVKHVQEMQVIPEASVEEMKRLIYQYGALQSSIYMDMENAFATSVYYNQLTYSYRYRGADEANHDICIIGWDDYFPAGSFNLNTENDGAFICQNSWGEEFGDNGIFYVSYEDARIRENSICYTRIEETDNYDGMYETDLCGWVGVLGYGDSVAYCANTFHVDSGECLSAVGFYATGQNTKYKIYVLEEDARLEHVNVQKPSAEGSVRYAGFYTISLTDEIMISEDRNVTIVIRVETPGSEYPIATEYVADQNTQSVDIADGDGYISHNGAIWQGTESSYHCNVCMKLYTKNY